jgi:hypothetical protein
MLPAPSAILLQLQLIFGVFLIFVGGVIFTLTHIAIQRDDFPHFFLLKTKNKRPKAETFPSSKITLEKRRLVFG